MNSINFVDFLKQSNKKEFWLERKVICFKGQDYPYLFFTNLFKFLENEKKLSVSYKNLLINSIDKIKLIGSLQQSFLGEINFYWLGEYKIAGTGENKFEFLKYLINYFGPNFISFFLNDEKIPAKLESEFKKITVINLDVEIDKSSFEKILKFYGICFDAKKINFLKKIFKQVSSLSLDKSYMLFQYLELVNTKFLDDFYEYLSFFITLEPSLFKLSQYFFSREKESFFKIWSKICNDYPQMFWISFWSEQIWKAYNIVKFLDQGKFAQAKSMSFRLPFMFIKQYWKNFSLNELESEHQFLYYNDFMIKKGSTFCGLDLFYFNHFMNKFSRKEV